jgi:hypothetical protein
MKKWAVTMLIEGKENFAEDIEVQALNKENAGLVAFKAMLEKYQGKGYRFTVVGVSEL